jgi:hypothetical protein
MKVSTIAEWVEYSAEEDEPRAEAIGELADEVRARFGVGRHSRVDLSCEVEWEYSSCDCCADSEVWWVIECGEEKRRISTGYGEAVDGYRAWLDEPRRIREREEAKAARDLECKRNDEAFTGRIVGAFTTAVADVEATGYSDTGEWHDLMMDRLGVGGHRYRE